MAFALPAFVVLLWSMVQLGLVYRANSGIQHSLGQGARFATLYPTPTDAAIEAKMDEAVYGIGPGTFDVTVTDVPASGYKDLLVTYEQKTDLLLFPGPTINVTKSKRVWVASTGAIAGSGGGSGTGTGGGGGSGTGTGGDSGDGGTPSPDPTPSDPPPPSPTPDPTPSDPPSPPPTTDNGNGNVVCTKKNGKPC